MYTHRKEQSTQVRTLQVQATRESGNTEEGAQHKHFCLVEHTRTGSIYTMAMITFCRCGQSSFPEQQQCSSQ